MADELALTHMHTLAHTTDILTRVRARIRASHPSARAVAFCHLANVRG